MAHCRVLVQLQAEIELLQQKLATTDEADAMPGSANMWRMHTAVYEDGWDSTQRDLLKELQDKLIAYGKLPLQRSNCVGDNEILPRYTVVPRSKAQSIESPLQSRPSERLPLDLEEETSRNRTIRLDLSSR